MCLSGCSVILGRCLLLERGWKEKCDTVTETMHWRRLNCSTKFRAYQWQFFVALLMWIHHCFFLFMVHVKLISATILDNFSWVAVVPDGPQLLIISLVLLCLFILCRKIFLHCFVWTSARSACWLDEYFKTLPRLS